MSVQPLSQANQPAPDAQQTSISRTLTGDEIAAKFMENSELVIARGHAERIRDRMLDLEHHDARELGRLLAGQ